MRLLAIAERALSSDDPTLAQILHRLAKQNHAQGNYAAAEPFYARVLSLREHVLGTDHPDTLRTRADYTELLRAVGRETELLSGSFVE